ncbi:MAG: hypothetical protein Unbinned3987contig1001_17 [Prokaryotic dsDNA virus sp.]|jgi:hypothetical protein|nr:MAG: hypothetical protein Unbinned3987contig1001_17 [Prokaryotic dsDNA virus sp.]|tara:strand:- start:5273 stop:5551 length:279 start_codon:yes stop_codon:yes gene_type:complete
METKFKLDKFSLYLDLGFTPKEVATLSITLDYRKEEFIRKISEARKDIIDYPDLAESFVDNIKYWEGEIKHIETLIDKLNINPNKWISDENK